MEPVSPVILETERLYAREFAPMDAESVFNWAGNEENCRYLPFGPESREWAEGFVRLRLKQQIEEPRRSYELAVCLNETDECIGAVRLALDGEGRQGELGYIVDMKHWGFGYACEIAGAMLRFAFMGLDLHRVSARCVCANEASCRVLEKLGMRLEGVSKRSARKEVRGNEVWRDEAHYAMLWKEYLKALPDGTYSPTGKNTD